MAYLSDTTPVGRRLDARIGATLMMVSVLSAFPAPIVGSGGQSGIALPAPTGRFGVGCATVEWTDRTRTEPLDATGGGRRLVVDVWYPAERTGGRAATYIDARAFSSAFGGEGLRQRFGSAADVIAAGGVTTGARAGAPFARAAAPATVLIFSHGGGMTRELYAAQLEDLASHGYVVAAVNHTYDAMLTILSDGRAIHLAESRWPPRPGALAEEADPDRLRWLANDIRFVLARLRDDRDPATRQLPVAGRLATRGAAAFGHSAGGQAAAHACQLDDRFGSCLNQDGLSRFAPYYLDANGWGMNQPFMLIERSPRRTPPSDAELATMKMTREEADALIGTLKARQHATLARTGGGSIRVLLNRDAISHMDFSDLPYLQARDDAERQQRSAALDVIRSYTRAFFDRSLRGTTATALDAAPDRRRVDAVETYPPADRR